MFNYRQIRWSPTGKYDPKKKTTFPYLTDPPELEKYFSYSESTMNNLSALLCKERQWRKFQAVEKTWSEDD